MAILFMKNEWMPTLPEHQSLDVDIFSTATGVSVQGDAPIDNSGEVTDDSDDGDYIDDDDDDDDSSDDDDESPPEESKNSNSRKIKLDNLPSPLSFGDLARLTSHLQARHAKLQRALCNATAALREVDADMVAVMQRLKAEKKEMAGIGSDTVGQEVIENNGIDEEAAGEDDDVLIKPRKRKGSLQPPVCPVCRVAQDLSRSQSHSTYQCVEHISNLHKADEGTGKGSATASPLRSARKGPLGVRPLRRSSADRECTVIFGLTPELSSTPSVLPKNKASTPKNALKQALETPRNPSPLSRRFTIRDWDDKEEVARIQSMQAQYAPDVLARTLPAGSVNVDRENSPLMRTPSFRDLVDRKTIAQRQQEQSLMRMKRGPIPAPAVNHSNTRQDIASTSRSSLFSTPRKRPRSDDEEQERAPKKARIAGIVDGCITC